MHWGIIVFKEEHSSLLLAHAAGRLLLTCGMVFAALPRPASSQEAGIRQPLAQAELKRPWDGRPPEPRRSPAKPAQLSQPPRLLPLSVSSPPLAISGILKRGAAQDASLDQPKSVAAPLLHAPGESPPPARERTWDELPRATQAPVVEPIPTAPTPDGEASGIAVLERATKLAAEAQTQRDFSRVIRLTSAALAADLGEETEGHASRLAAWAHNRRGLLADGRGDQAAALADFSEAVQRDPESWQAVHNRGVSYAARQHFDRALEDFDRALRLNPTSAIVLRNRAKVLSQMGVEEAAVEAYTAAIKLDPGWAELHRERGELQQRLGRPRQAVLDFNQALRLQPDQAAAYVARGKLYADLGYPSQALKDYQAALRADTAYAPAYQAKAWLLATCPWARHRDAQQALTAARRAVALHGEDNAVYLDTLAAALAAAGQFSAAAQVEQRVIRLARGENVDLRPWQHRLALYRRQQPYRAPKPSVGR